MQRAPHSFGAYAKNWGARKVAAADRSPGHVAFAAKQQAFWLYQARHAQKSFKTLLENPAYRPPAELSLLFDPSFEFMYTPVPGEIQVEALAILDVD
jgi:hypothetical protein